MIRRTLLVSLITALSLTPLPAAAQGGITVSATPTAFCSDADFEVAASGGSGTFDLAWDFGDGELLSEPGVTVLPHTTSHAYPGTGVYAWSLTATDPADVSLVGMASGDLAIGPQVTLTSDPFPPLLTLSGGTASLSLTADATAGTPPYSFAWDLEGDGTFTAGADPTSPTTTVEFTAPADTTLGVQVTDDCGLVATATLQVVVLDEGKGCHPMAQRLAQAVSSLFPGQAQQLYSCEDIFAFFTGGLTGDQLGFGRMWHAYQLALTMPDLTWEQILDWHLNVGGWGLLLQLQRSAAALENGSLLDLYTLALSGEHTLQDLRAALRTAVRFQTDVDGALALLETGASPGEVQQLYRLADELGVPVSDLEAALAGGASLKDLRSAARLAEQAGGEWTELAQAHADGASWGEIRQALRLADEQFSTDEILALGVSEFRRSQHGNPHEENLGSGSPTNEADLRMAERIASQYQVTTDQVWVQFWGACAEDWSCVRAYFRNLSHGPHNPHGGNGP